MDVPLGFTQRQLEAWLDEALPAEEMTRIEEALRQAPELARQLVGINGRRDAGVHSLGEIWRRHRVSCPSRTELGNHLLGILPAGQAEFIRFHLEAVGCRYCQANLSDLQNQQAEAAEAADRRKKYFQSSAGLLPRR